MIEIDKGKLCAFNEIKATENAVIVYVKKCIKSILTNYEELLLFKKYFMP